MASSSRLSSSTVWLVVAGTLIAIISFSQLSAALPNISDLLQHSASQVVMSHPGSERAEVTTTADKFTPEILLGAPRRSAALPNSAGTHALYTVSTYSFESHKKTTEIRLFDLDKKQSTLVSNDEGISEPHWLEDEILYLKSGVNGTTELVVVSAAHEMKGYTAAVIPGPISDLKLAVLEKGKVAVVATGSAASDGSLYNPELEPPKQFTGLLYDTLMVRHWDRYVKAEKFALFYGLFQLSTPHVTETKGRYSLSPLQNALLGTDLESPMDALSGSDHYNIGKSGLMFVAKDPELNLATNTKCNAYILPIAKFTQPADPSGPLKVALEGFEGAATSPALSPDGRSAVFMQMKQNGYEADKNRIIYIPDIAKLHQAGEVLESPGGKGLWDRSPSQAVWSNDGKVLYLVAEDKGRSLLWKLDVKAKPSEMQQLPEPLTEAGAVSAVSPLGKSAKSILFSGSSLIDNSRWFKLDLDASPSIEAISSNSRNGTAFGLSEAQVSDIWYKGANEQDIHAWVLKPSNFDAEKKYPLAFLIHGGPQGAWDDGWSTRWNPVVFAEQGYVVVAPNPTGSTSYGQKFCDDIQNNWGGLPYADLDAGFEYIRSSSDFSYVDTDRAVALGASYGGYMVNWINGHPLGRKFKAMVCHDGVFSMQNQLSSDELYFPVHEMGGPFWASPKIMANWDRWDPARYTGNWDTPTLIIHNEKDYRLPISEGLAAFNVLQMRGVESRFLTFPDENHWVLKEENSLVWHTVVLNWINKHVGLPPYKEDPPIKPEKAGRGRKG